MHYKKAHQSNKKRNDNLAWKWANLHCCDGSLSKQEYLLLDSCNPKTKSQLYWYELFSLIQCSD